jgi:hypothetical protein
MASAFGLVNDRATAAPAYVPFVAVGHDGGLVSGHYTGTNAKGVNTQRGSTLDI